MDNITYHPPWNVSGICPEAEAVSYEKGKLQEERSHFVQNLQEIKALHKITVLHFYTPCLPPQKNKEKINWVSMENY